MEIPREVAERVLRNIAIWLDGDPSNDAEWLAKMDATREIREDFQALLATSTD